MITKETLDLWLKENDEVVESDGGKLCPYTDRMYQLISSARELEVMKAELKIKADSFDQVSEKLHAKETELSEIKLELNFHSKRVKELFKALDEIRAYPATVLWNTDKQNMDITITVPRNWRPENPYSIITLGQAIDVAKQKESKC